jgi:ribonuclease Z
MKFQVTVLGSGSALPTLSRNPSAQILDLNDRLILIDCGEGTQVQLRKHKVKYQRIDTIFITHLHGDHYFGLVGLLNTMELMGRKKDLTIVAPKGLKEILDLQMKYGGAYFNYKIRFNELTEKSPELVFEDKIVKVHRLPLKHRIVCFGYKFEEKAKAANIKKDVIDKYNLDYKDIIMIKEGNDLILDNGSTVPNKDLVIPPRKLRSYAYCSDTSYNEELVPYIRGVDLLYHESTFLHQDAVKAKKTGHSTTKQAAKIAELSEVKTLMLGHYSIRYLDLEPFKREAEEVFSGPVIISDSGLKINIDEHVTIDQTTA